MLKRHAELKRLVKDTEIQARLQKLHPDEHHAVIPRWRHVNRLRKSGQDRW